LVIHIFRFHQTVRSDPDAESMERSGLEPARHVDGVRLPRPQQRDVNGNLIAAANARGWGRAAFSWGSATTGQWGL